MESVIVASLVKGTLLLLLAFGVTSLMRGTSAAARHAVWSAALAGVIAIPLLTMALPWKMSVLPEAWRGSPDAATALESSPASVEEKAVGSVGAPVTPAVDGKATADGEIDPVPVPGSASPSLDPSLTTPEPASVDRADPAGGGFGLPRDPWRMALLAWLVVGALILGRIVIGMAWMWRLARRAEPLSGPSWILPLGRVTDRLDLRTAVRIVRSDAATMPVTCGVMRPAVVLPLESEEWTEERREAVLLHELAHVRRGDLATHLIAWVACSVYWFHPLAWIAARRLRHESERACDDLVLGAGTRASEYATHLLDIVRAAGRGTAPAATVPMAQKSSFEGRLLAILEPGIARQALSPGRKAVLAVALALIVLPLAAMAPAEPEAPGKTVAGEREKDARLTIPLDAARSFRDRIAGVIGLAEETNTETESAAGSESNGAIELVLDGLEPVQADKPKDAKPEKDEKKEVDPRKVAALVASLRDSDAGVRATAAQALGELDDPRAVEALLRALATDTDPGVRKMAAWALGEIESDQAVPGLAQAMRNDRVTEVRSMAAWALGEIESPQAVPALGEALRDSSVEVRRMAIWALGEIEAPEAVQWLIPAVRDADVEVRRKAVWALGEIESEAGVDALSGATRDSDAEVRSTAVWALGEIESPRAIPGLRRALSDADPEVRQKAVWALGEIEDVQAVGPLTEALSDENAEVRRTAAWAIGEIQPARAPHALVTALQDGNAEVRKSAAWAIGEIQDASAAPALRSLLQDSNKEVRKTAIWALTEMDDEISYDILIELLKDEDPEVRKQAAQALGDR